MRLRNLDLLMATGIAAMNVAWALLPGHIPVISIMLALPLVLILPGYTLTEVLFHARFSDIFQRLLFSIGLSMAVAIITGFMLNLLPVGLQALSWAVSLSLFTTIFSLLAARLRQKSSMPRTARPWPRIAMHEYILLGLATTVTIFSLQYAATGVTQQPHPGFTQLWMLPVLQAGSSCAINLGIRSFETTPVTYSITITANGTTISRSSPIVLAPQQGWQRVVPVTLHTGGEVYLQAQLYRSDAPETVYRKVNLLLHPLVGNGNATVQPCGT
ncbi:MAG: DUF1616 domain-containing protein [Chloroflexota bacterium]|nr:DUF1616 domain-containing protein [Chloroflexota bacterium]